MAEPERDLVALSERERAYVAALIRRDIRRVERGMARDAERGRSFEPAPGRRHAGVEQVARAAAALRQVEGAK